ncbi:hypothetical protein PROFUN_10977 [Planoprotostelium fungivorum]|uniref:Uncharacterized protein n=1 Tax=Planoprotostelium fungivorum TaxID=1890364 RepID=A0A2P6NBW7_9EUKA|nr:hypothetical protein PROFUN_10977 [Planoprotostelium fungivorum]
MCHKVTDFIFLTVTTIDYHSILIRYTPLKLSPLSLPPQNSGTELMVELLLRSPRVDPSVPQLILIPLDHLKKGFVARAKHVI